MTFIKFLRRKPPEPRTEDHEPAVVVPIDREIEARRKLEEALVQRAMAENARNHWKNPELESLVERSKRPQRRARFMLALWRRELDRQEASYRRINQLIWDWEAQDGR